MTSGACLCGAVAYEVEGPFSDLLHCHCSVCRKHHGAPFATFVSAPAAGFTLTRGADQFRDYASSPSWTRRFCATCGSKVPTVVGGRAHLHAGNLPGDLPLTGGAHAYAGSKAPWHVIGDGLLQHDAGLPGWPPPMPDRVAAAAPAGSTPGSCACGAVTFVVSGAPARWMQCHCSRCRRGRSAVHGSNTFYPLASFEWRSGREHVVTYRLPEAQRFAVSFCARCGGGAPTEREGVPFVLVPAALLDADPGTRPEAHIHVASGTTWYRFDDGVPRFDALPA